MALRGTILTLGARAKELAAPAADRVLADGAEAIVEAAKGPWPVKTGRSRAALVRTINGHRIAIKDTAGYALAIRSGGIAPWSEYVIKPVRVFVKRAPKLIGGAILRALRVR